MLKAVILEDEEHNREILNALLQGFCPQVNVLATLDTVEACLLAINTVQPDLVFMDIELCGETCFDLLKKIGLVKFEIIFTTAYENYMLKAIKLSAIDYLLKPINGDELKIAVEKAERKRNQLTLNKNMELLLNNMRSNSGDHQVAISSAEGFVFVKVSNIVYLKSEGAYTFFFLKHNEKIITSKSIKEYEDVLTVYHFFRIHKSYIVNMGEIVKYIKGEGGQVLMSNNALIDVSRRKKDEFLQLFEKL